MRRRSLGRGEDSTKPRGGPLQAGDVEAGKRSNVGVSLFLIFYQIYIYSIRTLTSILQWLQRAGKHGGGTTWQCHK